jgi:SnoaL-like domain
VCRRRSRVFSGSGGGPALSPARSRLDEVERRLAALEDERAILDRLYRYSYALDSGDRQAFLDCFTDDHVRTGASGGRWSIGGEYRYEGIAAMDYYFDSHTHAPDLVHVHFLGQPLVQLDGDRATTHSYLVRVDESPDGPYVDAIAIYDDGLVRCPDGAWRIKERRVTILGWLDRESSARVAAEVRARHQRAAPDGTRPAM